MSGGGRCNFTNLHCEPAHFISHNPPFCISALSRYTQWDFIALVQKHGIAYHEKTLGQLCPTVGRPQDSREFRPLTFQAVVQQLDVALDDGQQVVEIVGHPARTGRSLPS